jgi:hypothetical protein
MAVGLVVLGAVLNIFIKQNETSTAQQEVAYAQQNVRAAMDLMVREIRNAGCDPEGTAFSSLGPIPQATGTLIRVRTDYRGDNDLPGNDPPYDPPDGNCDDDHEDVTYTVNTSGQLTRNGTRIVDSVGYLAFGYVLADGTMLGPPAPGDAALDLSNVGGADRRDEIRAVIIWLGIETEDPAPDTGEPRLRYLENGARIRNLGFKDIS